MDFLGRDQSPLTQEEWATLEEAVIRVAKIH